MSAILAIVGESAAAIQDIEVQTLLATMSHRGAERQAIWRSPGVVLAVSRDTWEMDPSVAGPVLVASRGSVHVVADATLYYRADLKARLRGAGLEVGAESSAELIAAAYEAFGPRCVDHLEGDFAFCVWDERERTLFAARDPFGTRGLFHLQSAGTFSVASTPHPLVARQGPRATFDRAGVLHAVLLRSGDGTSTGWKDVHALPAGHTLLARPRGVEVAQYWAARGSDRWRGLDTEEAAATLAELLDAAARERQHPAGTSLALSGGQDSTAVLAGIASGDDGARGPVHLLSFLYPEGDPGNEAWYIEMAAARFHLPVHWVEIATIGLFAGEDRAARLRSYCPGHLFEGQNRWLAKTSLGLGSRVLMSGHGGDNVFAVGDYAMADLLRSGRLLALRRFLKERGYRGYRQFVSYCLRPALPYGVFDLIESVRGRRICSRPYERPLPPWVIADEPLMARVTKEDREHLSRSVLRHHSSVTGRRRAWSLMDDSFARVNATLFDLTRDEGVELRLPMYDQRVVEFAMSRPSEEFNQPRRQKVLLRRALEGRLPARNWAPVSGGLKPGSAVGLLESGWTRGAQGMLDRINGRAWISEELGVIDRRRVMAALEGATSSWARLRTSVDMSLALFTESWLQANDSRG